MLYLVYRHGSNAANQSMCNIKALCLVEAESPQEARWVAEEYHTFYANQYSEAVPSKLRRKDTNAVMNSVDNDVYNRHSDAIRHPQIIATVEPQMQFAY